MKILLDTNVVLDHILSREPHVESVRKIMDLICRDELEAAITANSITDIYYIISKRLGDAVAREALRNLINILVIISVDGSDCLAALNLPMPDFEDAVIAVCAGKSEIDYVISNDRLFCETDYQLARVITTDDLLRLRNYLNP